MIVTEKRLLTSAAAFGGVLHVVSTALLGITAVTMANTIAGEETVHKLASLLLIFLGASYILLFALGKGGHSHAHNHPMEKMAVAGLVLVPALSPCATTLPVFLAVGNSSSMMILAIIVLLFRSSPSFTPLFFYCICWYYQFKLHYHVLSVIGFVNSLKLKKGFNYSKMFLSLSKLMKQKVALLTHDHQDYLYPPCLLEGS
jgi:hypothetical protein